MTNPDGGWLGERHVAFWTIVAGVVAVVTLPLTFLGLSRRDSPPTTNASPANSATPTPRPETATSANEKPPLPLILTVSATGNDTYVFHVEENQEISVDFLEGAWAVNDWWDGTGPNGEPSTADDRTPG